MLPIGRAETSVGGRFLGSSQSEPKPARFRWRVGPQAQWSAENKPLLSALPPEGDANSRVMSERLPSCAQL